MGLIYEPKGRAAEYSPLALNIYKGCSHGCNYCYAPSATYTDRASFHDHPSIRKNFYDQLEKDLPRFNGDRRPILLCFTCDPYQPLDETAQLTRWTLNSLLKNGNTVRVLTKGGMRASKDFEIMASADGRCEFGATLTFLDKDKSISWEPNAAEPADRMEALKVAKSIGIKTWVSLEPVIDPLQSIEIIKKTYDFVDLYKVGKMNYHPISKTIDWRKFRIEVEGLLKSLKKDYYIKKDLQVF